MATYPYFLDIETVPQHELIDDRTANIYADRFEKEIEGGKFSIRSFYNRTAGLYAEFGKIICVSIGIIKDDILRIKTIAPEGPQAEKRLLEELFPILDKAGALCAHNGKEFDFPFLQRRMLIHGMKLPICLQTMGKKPWEVLNEDTMEMWAFGSFKHRASLEMLANAFGIPSSKDDIDGSMVRDIYYEPCPADVLPFDHNEKIMKRLGTYCAADVVVLANVYLRIKGQTLQFKPENIIYI